MSTKRLAAHSCAPIDVPADTGWLDLLSDVEVLLGHALSRRVCGRVGGLLGSLRRGRWGLRDVRRFAGISRSRFLVSGGLLALGSAFGLTRG